jgi:hypothetical protein
VASLFDDGRVDACLTCVGLSRNPLTCTGSWLSLQPSFYLKPVRFRSALLWQRYKGVAHTMIVTSSSSVLNVIHHLPVLGSCLGHHCSPTVMLFWSYYSGALVPGATAGQLASFASIHTSRRAACTTAAGQHYCSTIATALHTWPMTSQLVHLMQC